MTASDSKSLPNSSEVSFSTNRLEELWTELIQVWPAVKKNPEIVKKIEHLWNILKTSNNAHIDINQEIQKYLDNSSTSTTFEASPNSNYVAVTASESAKTTSTSTQDNEDLDSLLSEILGEDSVKDTTNISGTEEIDRLIASVLGENWLNEETSPQPYPENQAIADSSSHLNIDTDSNIDELVTSILSEDVDENTDIPEAEEVYLKPPNIAADKSTIDKLLNDILAEDNEVESLTIDNNRADKTSNTITEQGEYQVTSTTEKEDIDELINEIINKDDEPESATYNINSPSEKEDIDVLINEIINKDDEPTSDTYNINSTTEEQHITATLNPEENIDNLINDVISNDEKETGDANIDLNKPSIQEKTQATSSAEKEDIDVLINEIMNKDIDSENTADNLNITAEESQSKTTELSPEKITIASGVTPAQKETPRITSKKPTPSEKRDTHKKTTKKESSNALLAVILVIVILSFIGVWMLFFNNEEVILADKTITTKIVKDSPFIEEITDEKPQDDTKPVYIAPKVEESSVHIEPEYTTKIETNNNDITITLNTPETALESEIAPDKNTAVTIVKPKTGDNIESPEKISETKPRIETPSKNNEFIEQSKKVKPLKTKAKRKVFIHKIVKGDTLWAIAKRYVNNPYRYPELAKLSKIKNPDRIYPGNTVTIIIYTK